jgi:uncharacterized protein YicC (UPF0701 family)
MSTATNESEKTAAAYLEDALEDLKEARQEVTDELRTTIDSAISRAREALDQARSDVEGRAEHLKVSMEERAAEWQRMLEDASDDVRHELGVRSVRAQHSPETLKEMADEIDKREKELKS